MSDADIYDELSRCYDLLGVARGASSQELKTAHRDMAKVWHPDRFAHDPRLQQKAQEKLKEINDAYDLLKSGKRARRASNQSSTNPPRAAQPATASARPFRWQLILLPVLVSGVVFFAAFRALVPSGKQSAQTTPDEPSRQTATRGDEEEIQPDGGANNSARNRKRDDARSTVETKPGGSLPLEERTPLPTVTLTVDPTTGLIATPDCPNKSRMTYPGGSEPNQYCNASHKGAEITEEQSRSKASRFKSFARRLASPTRLLKGDGESDKERPDR
jgi:hypothetical protein